MKKFLFYFIFSFQLDLSSLAKQIDLIAMCYGPGLYNNKTANGQILTKQTLGVAHRCWKLGSNINLTINKKTIQVKVIDRGPFNKIASLDLTEATVKSLGYANCSDFGVRHVKVEK